MKLYSKRRNVPYYESFPYRESSSFRKLKFGKHQHFVIASFFILLSVPTVREEK